MQHQELELIQPQNSYWNYNIHYLLFLRNVNILLLLKHHLHNENMMDILEEQFVFSKYICPLYLQVNDLH